MKSINIVNKVKQDVISLKHKAFNKLLILNDHSRYIVNESSFIVEEVAKYGITYEKVIIAFTYILYRNEKSITRIKKLIQYQEHQKAQEIFDTQVLYPHKIKHQLLQANIIRVAEGETCYLDKLAELYTQHPVNILVSITYAIALTLK